MASSASVKDRLADGNRLTGVISPVADPAVIEMCGYAGFDVYILDLEHGCIDDAAAESAVRAGQIANIAVLARLSLSEVARVGRFLDAGGAGVVFAHVASSDDVGQAVSLVRFPPTGRRGAGQARYSRYGADPTTRGSLREQDERVVLGIQIEDRDSVAMARELADNVNVDWLFIGTRDLSVDLGVPGEFGSPAVTGAVDAVRRACAAAGKPLVEIARDPAAPPSSSVVLVSLASLFGGVAQRLQGARTHA